MSRRQDYVDAAVESVWMCRLAEARIRTPTPDPDALARYEPVGLDGVPWVYDWYCHVLGAHRLREAARALQEQLDDGRLAAAIEAFEAHWSILAGLRNVVQHVRSRDVAIKNVLIGMDAISYLPNRGKLGGSTPQWQFTLDQLHSPVEALFEAVETSVSASPP